MKQRKSLLHIIPYAVIFHIFFSTEWLRTSSTSIIHNLTKFFSVSRLQVQKKVQCGGNDIMTLLIFNL